MNFKQFYESQVLIIVVIALFKPYTVMSQLADSSLFCHNQCCMEDHAPVGVMISHTHPKSSVMISYRFMRMGMNSKLSGTQKVSEDQVFNNYLMSPQSMRMDMHMLMVMYGLSNRITLMSMLNYSVLHMDMAMLTTMNHIGHTHTENTDMSMQTSGIGDTKVYALYDLFSTNKHIFLLSLGLSIPTGSIRIKGGENTMYQNLRFPYAMQLGSGSYDLLPAITYLRSKGSFSLSIQAASVFRSNYNAVGYKLGNEFISNAWAAYKWNYWISTSFRVEETIIGKIQGADPILYSENEPAANKLNYGGHRFNIYLGINIYFKKGFLQNQKLAVEYGYPIYQQVNGLQSAVTSTLFAGWQVAF